MKLSLRRAARDDHGSIIVEFAFAIVPLVYAIVAVAEIGGTLVTQQVLDQVTFQAAEQVANGALIGKSESDAVAIIKSSICAKNLALIDPSACNAGLHVDVRDVSAGTTVPSSLNADGTINTGAFGFQSVPDANLIMVRAAIPLPQISPIPNPALNNMPGGRLLVSTSVTRLESYARYNQTGTQ